MAAAAVAARALTAPDRLHAHRRVASRSSVHVSCHSADEAGLSGVPTHCPNGRAGRKVDHAVNAPSDETAQEVLISDRPGRHVVLRPVTPPLAKALLDLIGSDVTEAWCVQYRNESMAASSFTYFARHADALRHFERATEGS